MKIWKEYFLWIFIFFEMIIVLIFSWSYSYFSPAFSQISLFSLLAVFFALLVWNLWFNTQLRRMGRSTTSLWYYEKNGLTKHLPFECLWPSLKRTPGETMEHSSSKWGKPTFLFCSNYTRILDNKSTNVFLKIRWTVISELSFTFHTSGIILSYISLAYMICDSSLINCRWDGFFSVNQLSIIWILLDNANQ